MPTNAVYKLGAEKVMTAQLDLTDATMSAWIVSNGYAQDLTTDEFVSDLGANILAGPIPLTGLSAALGTFDADDVTFPAVASGDTAEAVIIALDSGTDSTSPLLLYLPDITGWPLATNGADIIAQFSSGAYKIWTIV